MKATAKQKQRIAIACNGNKERKAALVKQFTEDTTKSSTNDLTFVQANELLEFLKLTPESYKAYAYFDMNKQSHKYILSLCRQLGWVTNHPTRSGTVPDLERLGKFIAYNTGAKKPLSKQSPEETRKTIYALEQCL